MKKEIFFVIAFLIFLTFLCLFALKSESTVLTVICVAVLFATFPIVIVCVKPKADHSNFELGNGPAFEANPYDLEMGSLHDNLQQGWCVCEQNLTEKTNVTLHANCGKLE